MTHPVSPLGELCEIVVGRTPSRANPTFWGEDYAWLSISDMGKSRLLSATKEKLSGEGAKLLSGRRAAPGTVLLSFKLSIGKVGIAAAPLFTNEAIASLPIRDPSTLLPKYLARYLEFADLTEDTNRAAMGQTLNLPMLRAIQIPVPPLPEQRRIAAILDQADELRTKRRRALTLLDELADSLFADMFGGAFGQGELRVRRLDEVTDVDDRINYGVVQPGDGVIDGIPLIRVGDLRLGGIRNGSLKQISNDIEKEYVRSRIRGTEILVSCVGSIGEVSTVGVEHIGFNVARAVARVPIADPVQRAYVAAALRSSPIQAYFKNETRTVSQPTLNIKQLAGTPIPWPKRSDMSVFQDRISKLRAAQRDGRQHDTQLDELFASLQHRAFRGEL